MRCVKRGLFITFEGIEGSGKSTQIKAMADWLRKKGLRVVLTREPGGTPLASRIRSLLLDGRTKGITPTVELLLYEIARRDHVGKVIRPALERGAIVLCDRFTDATEAYQGYGRGLSPKIIDSFNRLATGGLRPDLTFLLDLPARTGLKRVKKRGHRPDRLERESLRFHERVRRGYLARARREKRRFRIIDARRSRKEICHELRHALEKLL